MKKPRARAKRPKSLQVLDKPITNLAQLKGRPALCNGAAGGHQCKHYWALVHPTDKVRGADESITRRRLCRLNSPDTDDLGSNGMEMPLYCNHYEPSRRKFDPAFERSTNVPVASGRSTVHQGGHPSEDQIAAEQIGALVSRSRSARATGAPPEAYPPAKDWDWDAVLIDGKREGYVHLPSGKNRTACGMLVSGFAVPPEIVALVPPGALIRRKTALAPEAANCPGCIANLGSNRQSVLDAAYDETTRELRAKFPSEKPTPIHPDDGTHLLAMDDMTACGGSIADAQMYTALASEVTCPKCRTRMDEDDRWEQVAEVESKRPIGLDGWKGLDRIAGGHVMSRDDAAAEIEHADHEGF